MSRWTALLCAIALASLCACSTSPIRKWQDAVETHVVERGSGDLNAVRSASLTGDRFDFIDRRAKIIEMFPSNRRDVHAVVLGRAPPEDRAWQVFLLGVVRYSGVLDRFPLDAKELQDIRLAAARMGEAGELVWRLSERDAQALAAYREAQGDEPPEFPTPADRIAWSSEGGIISATDERSGASWTLDLGAGD